MSTPTDQDIDYQDVPAVGRYVESAADDHNEWCYASLDEVRRNMASTEYPENCVQTAQGPVKSKILKQSGHLSAGDLVEVRSQEEILRTLDERGQLDGLPFMPEMFAFCGRRFRVFKRAHKTCDTVNDYKGRRMKNAVHLEGLRCDGQSHGGCEASCLIFWKEAWLRKVSDESMGSRAGTLLGARVGEEMKSIPSCTEADVLAGTRRYSERDRNDFVYVCQATQVPAATKPLAWWDLRQYVEDYASGNVGLARMARGFIYRGYQNLIRSGIGLGPLLRWLYDAFQSLRGGTPYPGWNGRIPIGKQTPTAKLDLQAGEPVRVKSYEAILATCDQENKNRGMTFDAEMVPYCGGNYRVHRRVTRIINERTGEMQVLANPCIVLDGVVCQARYSACRLFCPRNIYPYWREIWLERLQDSPDRVDRSV